MSEILRSISVGWQLRVLFTEDVFAEKNPVLADVLADHMPRKALVVLEDALAQSQPGLEHQIQNYFAAHAGRLQLVRPPLFVPGGESSKNSVTIVTDILSQIDRHHIDRHSYLVAVGGGALLDIAGFAAATAHRGVRHVRIPTTTLSQADSGVGVKNSINAFGKKNFVGTFAPPNAVINDFNLLATLKPRDKRAGYVEAVKVACIRDANFFNDIERDAEKLTAFEPAAMKKLIHRCAELHLDHIVSGGDPFENGSARPLDFGHWSAHKLEQLSNFRISHAEAVAIGIALDVIYSREIGLLPAKSCERILSLLEKLGFDLFACELTNDSTCANGSPHPSDSAHTTATVHSTAAARPSDNIRPTDAARPSDVRPSDTARSSDSIRPTDTARASNSARPSDSAPAHKNMCANVRILPGLEEFREHLGGELTITLLKEIGNAVEVHEMDPQKITAAIQELRGRVAKK